jgi:hypothetical protein
MVPFSWVNLEQPPDEIKEEHVLAFKTSLEVGPFGHEDLDLAALVATLHCKLRGIVGRLLLRCLAFLNGLSLYEIGYILVEQFLFGEEIVHQPSFLHHVLREGTDDTDHASQ